LSLSKRIANDLGIDQNWVTRIVARAPYAYKTYTIKKKTKGHRVISQPARETKAIQYWLIQNVFSALPIHDAATAYKEGASIIDNANRHKSNAYIAKFDFKDFFTSIKEDNINLFFKSKSSDLSDEDLRVIVRICCIHNRQTSGKNLSIGAPSSPILSNILLFDLDSEISRYCNDNGIIYTRYADDMTFSSSNKDKLQNVEQLLIKSKRKVAHLNLRINHKKTIFLSKKHSRNITGIIITNDQKLSIGRDKKRTLSATIHRYTQGALSAKERCNLQGHLAHAKNIEPLFISRLRGKYGSEIIDKILKGREM
jgi:RNA-directed DNA polymerase